MAKYLISFTLIFAIIAYVFGYINFDAGDYKDMTFQEQTQIYGQQFNQAITGGTEGLKKVANTVTKGIDMISSILATVYNGLAKIAKFFGIDTIVDSIFNTSASGSFGHPWWGDPLEPPKLEAFKGGNTWTK